MRVAGVDTHKQSHALCVLDACGTVIFKGEFEANESGYALIAQAIGAPDDCRGVGVEGTSTYGAGLTRALLSKGYRVYEVLRPKRAPRRPGEGKNDIADAERAARDVAAGINLSLPRSGVEWVDQVRMLHAAREQAVKIQTATINAARGILITAPERLRRRLEQKSSKKFMESLLRKRTLSDPVEAAAIVSLRCLAKVWKVASEEAAEARCAIKTLMDEHARPLVEMTGSSELAAAKLVIAAGGCGERLRDEAAFASLCGVAPVEASSGKVHRHRLNRGGDRQANRALFSIVLVRMRYDERTRKYVEKRTREGLSKKEIMRCLKRYVAREVYKNLKKCS